MTDLRDAARQALEALKAMQSYAAAERKGLRICDESITALRAALDQPEQTNPWRDAVDDELVSLHMVASDDPRESIRRLIDWHCAVQIDPLVSSAAQELIERGRREALEQPVQEPLACPHRDEPRGCYRVRCQLGRKCVEPLYTHPPRREWRGLTEEEIVAIFLLAPTQPAFARAIEAALKERNA